MAAPTYATDLTTVTLADSGSFLEFSGWSDGVIQSVPETDYFIQGVGCVSCTTSKAGNYSVGFDYGSGITVPTDGAVLMWHVHLTPNSLDTYANGGQRMFIGNSSSAFYQFYVGGSDRSPNPYGGWNNVAVNPDYAAGRDATTGSPTGTWQVFGIGTYLPTTAPSKGAPLALDAMRYGRCEFRVTNGDGTSGYATFAGMAQTNDYNDATNGYNRWGLFQAIAGGYKWKGLMSLGYSGTAVDFRDSDVSFVVDDTPKVTSGFNAIEINVSTSRVDWTNVIITALGTQSPGSFEVVDNADVNFDTCQFTDMGAFTFLSNSSCVDSVFTGCGQIDAGGAVLTGCTVQGYEGTSDTAALVWNVATDPDGYLDDMTFVKGTASTHAIEFGTSSPTSMTLDGCVFSGYNASDGQTDSALYFARTSGTVTVSILNGSIPSYKSAGATITISSSVPITITVVDEDDVPIQNAQTALYVGSTEVVNTDTNASGIVSTSYSGSTPASCSAMFRSETLKYRS